jgi:hypothetical protein
MEAADRERQLLREALAMAEQDAERARRRQSGSGGR